MRCFVKAFPFPHFSPTYPMSLLWENLSSFHLSTINGRYRRQDFSMSTAAGGENQYGFSVNRLRVFEDATGDNPVPGDAYTANQFLEAFSTPTWGVGSCLVHMFTYR